MPKARFDDTFEMHYEDDDFTDPWRTPETVIMQHGNDKNGKLWYAWIPLLSGQYRLIRPDFRGQGQSLMPPHKYTWKGFADDMNALVESLGLQKVHLLGETLGGTLCLLFAHYYPDKVKSLAMATSPCRWTDLQVVATLAQTRRWIEEGGVILRARESFESRLGLGSDPGHDEWYQQEMGKTPLHSSLDMQDIQMGADICDFFRQVQVPTLIMCSEESHAKWPRYSKEVAPLIPNCRLEVFPGTGGFIAHSEPALCAATWKEFVAGLD